MIQEIPDYKEGQVIMIDKPFGWTSFGVVKKVRYHTKAGKVGHAGTLDPLATGLLILCTGKFTKKIDTYQAQEKEYTGTFVLGATTPSYDLETEVDQTFDISGLTPELIREAVAKLTGEIIQVPPVYSAVKVGGKPAYIQARKGREVKMNAKPITIKEFEITRVELPEVDFRIVCSKGTYIRSLASDLGKLLDNGAHLSKLVRTRIGEYRLEDAWEIDDFLTHVQNQNRIAENESLQKPGGV